MCGGKSSECERRWQLLRRMQKIALTMASLSVDLGRPLGSAAGIIGFRIVRYAAGSTDSA